MNLLATGLALQALSRSMHRVCVTFADGTVTYIKINAERDVIKEARRHASVVWPDHWQTATYEEVL